MSLFAWDRKNCESSVSLVCIIVLCTIVIMWTFECDWIVTLGSFIKVFFLSFSTQCTPFCKPLTGGKRSKIGPTRKCELWTTASRYSNETVQLYVQGEMNKYSFYESDLFSLFVHNRKCTPISHLFMMIESGCLQSLRNSLTAGLLRISNCQLYK